MKNRKFQKQRILKYLQTHKKGITQLDAYLLFDCFRLGARILELKQQGNKIIKTMETNNKKRFARYQLI